MKHFHCVVYCICSVELTNINEPMVGDLPAALQPQHIQCPRLLWGEVRERGVGDVVGLRVIISICFRYFAKEFTVFGIIFQPSHLEVELVEGGQELCDGADALVGHVDAVCDGEADEARVEAGPEALHQSEVSTRSRDPLSTNPSSPAPSPRCTR